MFCYRSTITMYLLPFWELFYELFKCHQNSKTLNLTKQFGVKMVSWCFGGKNCYLLRFAGTF